MKCADPKLRFVMSNGKEVWRHFSLAGNLLYLPHMKTDCGTCIHCRKKRALELACRCVLHASLHKRNMFLTLTYDEKREGYHNNFEYPDIQKFKKRLRRKYEQKKIDIFNVHEYGKNGKKHWHLAVFNHGFADRKKNPGSLYYNSETLAKLWPFGYHSIGDITEASAMYQAQYMEKDFKHGYVTNKKKAHSIHRGLGGPYFLAHFRQILSLGYVPFGARKLPVPRYFERLAHKHYCHFNDRSAFEVTSSRKFPLYSYFRAGEASREISDCYAAYKVAKDERSLESSLEWDEVVDNFLTEKIEPDFIQSSSNTLYDLQNKKKFGEF